MAKLLLVDDEYAIVEILSGILRLEGHSVVVAANGEEGLLRLRADPPDLLILDMMMPKMSGHEMLAAARRERGLAHLPVLLMSAAARFEKLEDGDPNLRFLRKPFTVEHLLRAINELLPR